MNRISQFIQKLIKGEIKPIVTNPTPAVTYKYKCLSFKQHSALVDYLSIAPGPHGLRNACMLMIMLDCGLRVGELVNLNISDIWQVESFKPTSHIRVNMTDSLTKSHQRLVPMTYRLHDFIKSYGDNIYLSPISLLARKIALQNPLSKGIFETISTYEQKPAFRSQKKHRFTTKQIQRITKSICFKALSIDITPHTLRHTYGTALSNAGVDIRIIKDLLGHRSLNSTVIYTHPGPDQLIQAVETLDSFHKYGYNTTRDSQLHFNFKEGN